ncbi:MAG TPA: hypothetical protein VGY90_06345 [Steroidobacteraceae bacterium]|nr:hypothetical protein [Steroidobacteraceae bacterium]
MLVITLFAWLPLAVLSFIDGHLYGGEILPFLRDIESQVRLLVALPLLIIAELVVHRRSVLALRCFVERRMVTAEDSPNFHAAIAAALRMRNSLWPEVALLLFVYTAGHWIWRTDIALGAATWYAVPEGTGLHLTAAGYWYAFVSIPIFQFILLRWYLRLGIWFWLLWRASRLNLHLLPTHPDRAGGLGFLGGSSYAFAPVLFAQGAVFAGLIANRIFYQEQNLLSFKMMIATVVSSFVLVIILPLTMFTPHLSHTKRSGLRAYGTLATDYAEDFDEKWIRGGAKGEALLGTTDIQSLADLGNGYAVVREMRLVPFTLGDVSRLVGTVALPVAPLLLTIMPLEELMTEVLKVMF